MAEEIIIGKLIIDTSDLESSMASSKKAIVDLENEQKKLKKDTEGLSSANEQQLQSFVDNELELKKLKAEYAANQKSVLELTRAQTGLDNALKQNITTQEQAKKNTAELTAARQKIDATTIEGAKAVAQINAKIDENNKFVNANSSALEKQKNNVGNYGMITENLSNLLTKQGGIFATVRTQVEGFRSTVGSSIDTVKSVHASVVGAAQGVIGFGNASKAAAVQASTMAASETVATGATEGLAVAEGTATVVTGGFATAMSLLLLPITALIVVGLALYSVFKDFSPVINPIKDAIASLGAVFVVLKTGILDVVTGARSLTDVFSSLASDVATATVETYKLEGAQRALTKSMDMQELASARTATKVKELVLQSKNLSLTEDERVAKLNEAQKLEEREFQKRFKNYKTEKDLIIDRIAVGKNLSDEDKARLTSGDYEFLKSIAKKKKLDGDLVEAYKKNQLSRESLLQEDNQIQEKAQNYKNKILEKDQAKQEKAVEKQKTNSEKAYQAQLKQAQSAIDVMKLEANARNLDASERLALAQKIFDAENALAQKASTGSDLQKQLITNRQNLSSAILAITDEQITKEAEKQKASVEATKAINAELYDSQSQSAEDLAKAQILLLDKKLLSEKDYANEVVKINQAKNESLTIIQANFDEAEKVRLETAAANAKILEDLSFQIRLQDIQDRDATEQEVKRALLQANYDNDLLLLQEQLDKEKSVYGLSKEQLAFLDEKYAKEKSLIDKKYKAETKKDDKILAAQKRATNVQMIQDSIGAAEAIFGESKALSIASALINTYQGITAGVKLGYPAAIPAVAMAAATGFAAVKNILKTDKGSSSIDSSSAKPQTTSGSGSFVNTAQTETVAKVSETPQQQNTVVTPPILILESLLEAQNNLAIKVESN